MKNLGLADKLKEARGELTGMFHNTFLLFICLFVFRFDLFLIITGYFVVKFISIAKKRKTADSSLLLFLCAVLRSEVEDVRCLLQAAERQVDSLKKERDMESIESGRRLAALESKVWC